MATNKGFSTIDAEDPEQTVTPLSVEGFDDEVATNRANGDNFHLLCCNSCCDFRRAVMAVDGLFVGFRILAIVFLVTVGSDLFALALQQAELNTQDDEVREQLEAFDTEKGIAIIEIVMVLVEVITIGLFSCGIYGALKFKRWGIIAAGCAYFVELLFALFSLNIGGAILLSCMLYPHWQMNNLMKAGIMTPDNYHNIDNCCGNLKK